MASQTGSTMIKRSASMPNMKMPPPENTPISTSPPTVLSEETIEYVNNLHEDIQILKPLVSEIMAGQRQILQEVREHLIETHQRQPVSQWEGGTQPTRNTPNPWQEAVRQGTIAAVDVETLTKWEEIHSTMRMLEPALKQMKKIGCSDECYQAIVGLCEAVLGKSMPA